MTPRSSPWWRSPWTGRWSADAENAENRWVPHSPPEKSRIHQNSWQLTHSSELLTTHAFIRSPDNSRIHQNSSQLTHSSDLLTTHAFIRTPEKSRIHQNSWQLTHSSELLTSHAFIRTPHNSRIHQNSWKVTHSSELLTTHAFIRTPHNSRIHQNSSQLTHSPEPDYLLMRYLRLHLVRLHHQVGFAMTHELFKNFREIPANLEKCHEQHKSGKADWRWLIGDVINRQAIKQPNYRLIDVWTDQRLTKRIDGVNG